MKRSVYSIEGEARAWFIIAIVFAGVACLNWYFYFNPTSYSPNIHEQPTTHTNALLKGFVVLLEITFLYKSKGIWARTIWGIFIANTVLTGTWKYWDQNLGEQNAKLVGVLYGTLLAGYLFLLVYVIKKKKIGLFDWKHKVVAADGQGRQ